MVFIWNYKRQPDRNRFDCGEVGGFQQLLAVIRGWTRLRRPSEAATLIKHWHLSPHSGYSLDATTDQEVLDTFPAVIRRLIPHLMPHVGQHDRLVVREEARQFFGDEPEKWVRFCPREQQHWNRDFSNCLGLDFGEKSAGGHHYIPFVGITQRFLTSRLGHLAPRLRVVEHVAHEHTDPSIAITAAKRLLHWQNHAPLNVWIHCFADFHFFARQMLQEGDGWWLCQNKSANKFRVFGGQEQGGERAV